MHPVIEHILARRGKETSANDGRKIVLVLYGGLMTGIRGAGALLALQGLGLTRSFDAVYAASAGFGNAAYFLSGEAEKAVSIYCEDLSGSKFIKLWRFWKIADIDYVVRLFQEIKPINVEKLWSGMTKLFVRLLNSSNKVREYLEIRDFDKSEFFSLSRASIHLQYFIPGYTKIKELRFMDGQYSWNDIRNHLRSVLDTDATDILVIYNKTNQKFPLEPTPRVYEIAPKADWKLSNLETSPEKLKRAAIEMGTMVNEVFENPHPLLLNYDRHRLSGDIGVRETPRLA